MINFLNIYKFNFPFLENKYEEVLFNSIFTDLEELFLYEELLESIDRVSNVKYEKIVLNIKNWKIELFFTKDGDYYIPKFQLNLFFKDKVNNSILIKIINIFNSFWIKNYFFDYDFDYFKNLEIYNLKNINVLEKNFELYWEKELNVFLKNMHKDYLEEELKNNPIIFDSLLYLIFIYYIFYENNLNSENIINDLNNKNINTNYVGIISLSKTRLKIVNDLNLITFNRYKKMLDTFFWLLK